MSELTVFRFGYNWYQRSDGREFPSRDFDEGNDIDFQFNVFNGKTYIHMRQCDETIFPWKVSRGKYVWIGKVTLGKLVLKTKLCLVNPDHIENLDVTVLELRGNSKVELHRTAIKMDDEDYDDLDKWELCVMEPAGVMSKIQIKNMQTFYDSLIVALRSVALFSEP